MLLYALFLLLYVSPGLVSAQGYGSYYPGARAPASMPLNEYNGPPPSMMNSYAPKGPLPFANNFGPRPPRPFFQPPRPVWRPPPQPNFHYQPVPIQTYQPPPPPPPVPQGYDQPPPATYHPAPTPPPESYESSNESTEYNYGPVETSTRYVPTTRNYNYAKAVTTTRRPTTTRAPTTTRRPTTTRAPTTTRRTQPTTVRRTPSTTRTPPTAPPTMAPRTRGPEWVTPPQSPKIAYFPHSAEEGESPCDAAAEDGDGCWDFFQYVPGVRAGTPSEPVESTEKTEEAYQPETYKTPPREMTSSSSEEKIREQPVDTTTVRYEAHKKEDAAAAEYKRETEDRPETATWKLPTGNEVFIGTESGEPVEIRDNVEEVNGDREENPEKDVDSAEPTTTQQPLKASKGSQLQWVPAEKGEVMKGKRIHPTTTAPTTTTTTRVSESDEVEGSGAVAAVTEAPTTTEPSTTTSSPSDEQKEEERRDIIPEPEELKEKDEVETRSGDLTLDKVEEETTLKTDTEATTTGVPEPRLLVREWNNGIWREPSTIPSTSASDTTTTTTQATHSTTPLTTTTTTTTTTESTTSTTTTTTTSSPSTQPPAVHFLDKAPVVERIVDLSKLERLGVLSTTTTTTEAPPDLTVTSIQTQNKFNSQSPILNKANDENSQISLHSTGATIQEIAGGAGGAPNKVKQGTFGGASEEKGMAMIVFPMEGPKPEVPNWYNITESQGDPEVNELTAQIRKSSGNPRNSKTRST
ncbi:unnamed protein product, partial [Mesorhabditis spiculigera]